MVNKRARTNCAQPLRTMLLGPGIRPDASDGHRFARGSGNNGLVR